MPDVQEVFRMATQKMRPDPGALERQNRSQKRHVARQKATVFVVVGALVIGGAVFGIITLRDGSNEVGRPTATPTAQPAGQPSPPLTERFDSPLHGLSIGYPSGWRTRAATEPWGHDEVTFDAPDVDVIFDPRLKDDLYLAVVSEPLGGKWRPGWIGAGARLPSVGICKRAYGGGGGRGTLDGADAWFEGCDTPFGSDFVVAVETATRGYIIHLHVGDEVPATYPVPDFEAELLETVDLRPEDALDALNPSESP
jgi:hypothetical protein